MYVTAVVCSYVIVDFIEFFVIYCSITLISRYIESDILIVMFLLCIFNQ